VFELLHGRYYPEFTTQLINVADVVVQTPSRAVNFREAYEKEDLAAIFSDVWDVVSAEYVEPISVGSASVIDAPAPDATNVVAETDSILAAAASSATRRLQDTVTVEDMQSSSVLQLLPWEHPDKNGRFSRGGFRLGDTFLGTTAVFARPDDPRGEIFQPRFSFLALLDRSDFDTDAEDSASALALPLNLPESLQKLSGGPRSGYARFIENDMFIGRNAEWQDGDPGYVLRHNGNRTELEAAALSESLQESSR